MDPRPCLRNLDKPIIALAGLEPSDLGAVLGVVGALLVVLNIGIALVGGLFVFLALKALKAGKPRGYMFYLFYRVGALRLWPAAIRPLYLVIPPGLGTRILRLSAVPGPEDDDTPEAKFFRGTNNYES